MLLLYVLAGGSSVSLASTSSGTSVSISSEFFFFERVRLKRKPSNLLKNREPLDRVIMPIEFC
jgi:hypothetical protein